MASESDAHRELKKLAVAWSFERGYRIQACEVSIPMLRVRIDVAACRISRGAQPGTVAFFECKQSVADFRHHSRIESAVRERLGVLEERRRLYEEWLQVRVPTLRSGESLFEEFDTWDFSRVDWEPYAKVLQEIEKLAGRLESNIKFDRMVKSAYANLHYLVGTPEVIDLRELPPKWGVLVQSGEGLELVRRPVWNPLSAQRRVSVLERIAAAASRAIEGRSSFIEQPGK